jgi:hypothetical protein
MKQEIQRVVVPLDAVSETQNAIDTAVRLAVQWQVPLYGIFIEDEELIGFAALPFAHQITLSAGLQPLTQDHIEDHFRAVAERAKHELQAAAERSGVKWSFEVVRGPLNAAKLGEHDFVIAGAACRPIGSHFRIASRWWSLTATIAPPLLLAKRQWETGGSIFALLRGRGPQSARMLEIAAQIAGISRAALTVAGPPDLAGADEFAAWVSELLEGHSLTFSTEPAAVEPTALRQRIIELDCRLLVLEGSPDEDRPEELRELVEPLSCDVLVVR